MRTGTVSYRLEDLKKGVIIPIGFVGENDFTRVIFDAEEIYKNYPAAQVSMKVQPPKGSIYPATVAKEGNTVIWQVKAADLAHRGSGELQLTFTEGNTVIKTYIARTDIKRSLQGNGTAPDPVQNWVDHAEDVLANVEAAEIHQPIIGMDGYWYTWNQETGEYEKTNTKAQGEDGAPGQDATPDLITVDYDDLTFPVTKNTQCYHNGLLYYAKQDIQTAEDWTEAHWQQTTVEEQVGQLKNAIHGVSIQENERFEKSVNLFDMTNAGVTRGEFWYYDGTHRTGQSNEYATSHLIIVEPGTYKFTGNSVFGDDEGAVVLYNLDGTFNKMNNATVENNICTVVFTEYGFAQFNIYYASIGTVMFTKASEWPEEYEQYYEYLKKDKLPALEISKEDTDFFEHEKSSNLFDGTDCEHGKYFNVSNGSLVSNSYSESFFVKIKEAGTYTTIAYTGLYGTFNGARVCAFDKDKQYIETIVGTIGDAITSAENKLSFEITSANLLNGLVYIGITAHINRPSTLMIVKGNTYPDQYIPYVDEWHIPDLTPKGNQFVSAGINNLYKKTVLFDGDSICNGSTDTSGSGAYAGRIAERNKMQSVNYAVSGGTLTSGLYYEGGTARHWVSTYIDTLYSNNPDADFIIFEGGTNDADLIGSILDSGNIPAGYGSWTADDFSGNYDNETFCGAVETIIYKAMNYWPHSKIGFVIAPKMGTGTAYKNRYAYFETIMNICKKWGMPYINLWDGCPMNPMLSSCYDSSKTSEENIQAHKLYKDGQHPTPDGYERIFPVIEAWMRTL